MYRAPMVSKSLRACFAGQNSGCKQGLGLGSQSAGFPRHNAGTIRVLGVKLISQAFLLKPF